MSLTHILILIIVFVILFRPRRIGDLAKSIGKASRNFKESKDEIVIEAKDIREIKNDPEQKS